MDLKDITKDLRNQTDYQLDRRFDELMRKNPSYSHLDASNRELIFDLIKKYKEKLRRGRHPSRLTIKRDMYDLYKDRVRLNLSVNDLDDIRDLLESFKGE
jgi:hypothetical protein